MSLALLHAADSQPESDSETTRLNLPSWIPHFSCHTQQGCFAPDYGALSIREETSYHEAGNPFGDARCTP
jgi:hypothetical protein